MGPHDPIQHVRRDGQSASLKQPILDRRNVEHNISDAGTAVGQSGETEK